MHEPRNARGFPQDVVVIGGCGHVGLPLAIAFASRGLRTAIFDVNVASVGLVNSSRMPFLESGADEPLRDAISSGRLVASADPSVVRTAEHVVVVIGTPVDEHLNPDGSAIPATLGSMRAHFADGQIIILRSTLFPGVTALVEKLIARLGLDIDVAYCPERIAEGKAMTELFTLPQIIACRQLRGYHRASRLFRILTPLVVPLAPEEAELAKLFTNVWRYVKFATVNQMYMIANDHGVDFDRVREGLAADYPRAADMPRAGLSAGPCLIKDTMQVAAYSHNNFVLGHTAMAINEGMPLYIVHRLESRFDLRNMTVGILGMAFKGESDDTRSSLAYKLKRILTFKARSVLCTDPYVTTDPRLTSFGDVIANSDLLVIAAPHHEYAKIDTDLPVVDIWNLRGNGVLV
jgi:UDP-N-acetyl-D-mannosaminuronic acid dehydrogenase